MTSQLCTTATGPACSNLSAMMINDCAKKVITAKATPYMASVAFWGSLKTPMAKAKMTHCNVPQTPEESDINEK